MSSSTFKVITGIIFPPLGAYYALRSVGLPSWAGTVGMGLFGGGLGIALGAAQGYGMLSGSPSAPNMPSITVGGGGMSGSPTYGHHGIQTSRR